MPMRYDLNFPNFPMGKVYLFDMLLSLIGTRRIYFIGGGFMVSMLLSCNNVPYDYLAK